MIEFNDVSKCFRRTPGQMLIRNHLLRLLQRGKGENPFWALKNVTFKVKKGESLAVIGPNGAGKSTLLGLVAGLAKPDGGKVHVQGRIAGLLELGSGFHPDLTGAENVRLNAALLGFTEKRTNAVFDEIVEFSGISDFIKEPLRTYSTGMTMRLAFSVAVHVDPDILLIDEVIAVGDQEFGVKCAQKIHDFRRAGKTMVCVSHNVSALQQLCDRAIWLDHGQMMMSGGIWKVTEAYAGAQVTTA
jgi:ABC-type polysaccharide/polyol phosphate transport system ATPase subunit